MLKKILLGGLGLLLVGGLGVYMLARSVLAQDSVREALAAQVSQAIGQPVKIGAIGASIFPRISVRLGEVAIGEPARIQVRALHVGTDLAALLSRRIEHGSMRLEGARIELPLPALAPSSAGAAGDDGADADAGSGVEIVSIDEIVLHDVEIVSGGRTLRGEIEAVPQGKGIALRRLMLSADDTTLEATGQITDLAGPVGELAIKADQLNFDRLLAFVEAFSGGAGVASAPTGAAERPATPKANAPAMNVTVSLDANRATIGALAIDRVSGRARVTDGGASLDPLAFGLFGGRYEGALALTLGSGAPSFRWTATLAGIDVAAATAFAGSPGTMTGRLAGRIDLSGEGADAAAAIQSARGTARIDIVDGMIKNLGLVRGLVVATSMRPDAKEQAAGTSTDEPFSKLGATLTIAGGGASTQDLLFDSENLRLAAAGGVQLDGSAINLKGQVQLSEKLTEQAGRDLVRYAGENGRVTLPATITGSASDPRVRIDAGDMAKRAIRNRATEEAQGAVKKGLGGLFKRP